MIKSKLFIKYIVSYTMLLFIPIFVLSIIIFNSFNNFIDNEITTSNKTLLEQSRNSIDSKFNEINKSSLLINYNPYLKSSFIQANTQNVITSTKLLKSFMAPNNFYESFYIVFWDNDLVLSPTGTFTTQYLFNSIFKNENLDFDKIKNTLIDHPKASTVKTKNYFIHIEPISSQSSKTTGAVFFTIPLSSYKKLLNPILESYNGMFLIIDENNNIIATFGNKNLYISDIKINLSQKIFAKKVILNNNEYFISNIKSKYNNWIYITLIPSKRISNKLSSLVNTAILGFIIIFIIGILLIYYLMKINYSPLHKLINLTSKISNSSSNNRGDITVVHDMVNNMNNKIQSLEHYVEDSNSIMKNELLKDLIKDRFTDIEEFNIKGKLYGVNITYNFFSVSIFLFKNFTEAIKQLFSSIIIDISSLDCQSYPIYTIDDNRVVLLISYNRKNEDYILSIITRIQQELKKIADIDCSIGIGLTTSSPENIGKSYLQAYTALDYRLIKGTNKVIHFNEIEVNIKNTHYYPTELLVLLKKQLSNKDTTKINETLSKIISTIKEHHIPLITARTLCYNLIQMILTTTYKNGYTSTLDDYVPNIIELARFETVEELFEQIQSICYNIFSQISNENEQTSNEQLQKIKNYINENYLNPNFSLQMISDDFNMSMSYMSRYFKSHARINISNYVNILRMDKAKELLEKTNMNLKDISLTVGYLNLSSFIRKFKQTTGITPGIYRETIYKK